jgi:hypothetical protein
MCAVLYCVPLCSGTVFWGQKSMNTTCLCFVCGLLVAAVRKATISSPMFWMETHGHVPYNIYPGREMNP